MTELVTRANYLDVLYRQAYAFHLAEIMPRIKSGELTEAQALPQIMTEVEKCLNRGARLLHRQKYGRSKYGPHQGVQECARRRAA